MPERKSRLTRNIAIVGIALALAGGSMLLAVFVGPAKPDPSRAPVSAPATAPATGVDGDTIGAAFIIIVYLIVLLVGMVLYFVPTIVAAKRGHHNVGTIIVINVLLGWTFIGWVVALAWSVSEVRRPQPTHF